MTSDPRYLRQPSIAGDRVAFVCEDDVWLVDAAGGDARRLTAAAAETGFPRLSPDGVLVAYLSREERSAEVFVTPVAGGPPRRLTHHGEVRIVSGWTADGAAVLYGSDHARPATYDVWLHEVAVPGRTGAIERSPLPRRLPLGPAWTISLGPGGARVIGRSSHREPSFWKGYLGGAAGSLWVDAAGDGSFGRLPGPNGNLACPCWVSGRIFFLSDHDGCANVYSCAPDGDDLRRHTDHTGLYARHLTGDGRRLVYQVGGDLFLLDPADGCARRLEVVVARGDRIYPLLNAANRDPDRFDDPERFDVRRPQNRHIVFGHGPHTCIGMPLARIEIPIAVEALLAHVEELALAGPPRWIDSIAFRGPAALPVSISPAPAGRRADSEVRR